MEVFGVWLACFPRATKSELKNLSAFIGEVWAYNVNSSGQSMEPCDTPYSQAMFDDSLPVRREQTASDTPATS